MIQTIEGRIGGGKTYTAMGWIINHLCHGGVVASNINIQLDSFKDQYGMKKGLRSVLKDQFNYILQDQQIIHLSDTKTVDYVTKKGVYRLPEIVMFYKLVPRGTPKQPVLVVLDEAHIHFPQDGYKSIPKEVLHFLTLSRHACVDVVFISQHIKNMWCQMLRLAQFRWMCRDMKKYGFPWGPFNIPWPFPHFLMVKNDYDGKSILGRKFEWHRTYLYETYKSPELAASFESMEVAASVEVKKQGLTMKQKIVLYLSGLLSGAALVAVPACVHNDPSGSVPVTAIESKNPSPGLVAASVDPVGSDQKDIEYFKAYFCCGDDVRLTTSRTVYRVGDFYDGKRIVFINASSVSLEDGSVHRFEPRPDKGGGSDNGPSA